jgi:hypothetical protein
LTVVIWSYLVVTQLNGGWASTGAPSLLFERDARVGDVLNKAGEQGWELVAATGVSDAGAEYIFKRPVDIGEEEPGATVF